LILTPYSQQCLDKRDIQAVVRVLRGSFLTQGPEIPAFEKEFAKFCGAKYAVACSSATAGLHLSAMVLGMGPGDLWWTSPNTFCATADAAVRCRSEVDFVDIEWGTFNMDLALLEKKLRKAAQKNRLPKVVAPVHFAGNPVDMELLDQLRKKYGFKVVEDAAHATGAEFRGERIGSCKWSDLCVFSFHAVKIITTGEGGMITTNSKTFYEKLCVLRTHGISRDYKYLSKGKKHPWYYEKLELGNHYRMTDIQAALGRSQIKKISSFRKKRLKIASLYMKNLPNYFGLPKMTEGSRSSWHLFTITVPSSKQKRDTLLQRLRNIGVYSAVHYPIVSGLRFYEKTVLNNKNRSFPVCAKFFRTTLSLPIYPSLSLSRAAFIVKKLKAWV